MGKNTIIKVEGLSKKYLLNKNLEPKSDTFYESFFNQVKNIGNIVKKKEMLEFWALDNVSFEIEKGDRVGIIGRNGAGKSTLLKILSRIIPPTKGRIEYTGRIASLLEVGTGFHGDLSGRENIYLNGSILGMSKQEVDNKFDEIVNFAEVEKFLDTPVKRYSSGMYVRLAFAVAAHLETDILVIDEVLAVGDAAFQKKCLGKMSEMSENGRTILFVSHNIGAVKQLCTRGIYLKDGKLNFDGSVDEIVDIYMRDSSVINGLLSAPSFNGPLSKTILFNHISLNLKEADLNFSPFDDITIRVKGKALIKFTRFRVTLAIYKGEIRVCTLFDTENPDDLLAGDFESTFVIPNRFLRPNEYSIAVGGFAEGSGEWLFGEYLVFFRIVEEFDNIFDFHGHGIVNAPKRGTRICR